MSVEARIEMFWWIWDYKTKGNVCEVEDFQTVICLDLKTWHNLTDGPLKQMAGKDWHCKDVFKDNANAKKMVL